MKKQNKMIIIVMVIVLSVVVGYALFNESLNVGGTASTGSSNFNIVFEKVNGINEYQSEGATASIVSGGKALQITVPGLKLPGAYAKIPVIIKNKGDITARLKNIITSGLNDPNIKVSYEGMGENSILNANDEKEMVIKVAWNRQSAKESTSINFKIEMNYEQVTSAMEESGEVPFIREANEVMDKAKTKASGSYVEYNLPGDKALLGVTSEVTGRVVVNEEGKTQIALHDKANKYCGLKKYYETGIDVVSYSENCIPESANNLIKNGYGEYQDNTNFSELTYDKQPFFSRVSSKYETIFNNEFIKVDANNNYYQSIEMKNNNTNSNYYVGIAQYDIDKYIIYETNVGYLNEKSKTTLTTLAKDLNPGDTVVYLSDVSKFENSPITYPTQLQRLGLIFWNYKDSTGYEYPELTYSRYSWYGIYEYTGIDKSNNTITLKKPWGYGTFKAGTKLSQTQPYLGSTYQYSVIDGGRLTSEWKEYKNESFKLKYNEAKYIKYMILNNYNSIPDVTTDFHNFVFRKAN